MKLPNFLGGTSRTGWEQLILSVLGTTISIALTFGTNTLVNNHKKKSDRRLAAVRVMSNIESYARQLDLAYESSTGVDSLASFLLTRMDDLKYLPEESIIDFTLSAAPKALVTYDSSAEQIFTSSFDVWRNVDNARFIAWNFSAISHSFALLSNVPVGAFGFARMNSVASPACSTASSGSWKSSVNATGAWLAPCMSARTGYNE